VREAQSIRTCVSLPPGTESNRTLAVGIDLAQTKLTLQAFRNILRNPLPSNMPPYRATVLTDQEVADLFAYIQSFPPPEPADKIPQLKK